MPDFPSTTSASGIWTLKKHKRAKQGSNWPGTADLYFPYVTMLLPGNGTNGAQNNTFLDSSTNNFSITRNGNTTQGTFAPYGANWSNFFDGSGDYLSAPDNAAWVLSGDFTIESWVYPSGSGIRVIASQWPGAGGATNQAFYFSLATGNYINFTYGLGSANINVTGTSVTANLNSWNHVAVTRFGTTVRLFVNGVQDSTTATVSGALNNSTSSLYIGILNPTDGFIFTGYISDLRLLNGTAQYTSNFTPPSSPLTAITNTSLLTCQSNRFIDNSANNFTITRNGDVSVQVFSPFSPTASYAAGTNGGSGYFDGTGDYLTVPSNAALAVGSTFTVECWVYRTVGSTIQWLAGNNAGSGNTNWLLEIEANNTVYGGGWLSGTQTVSTVPVAAWTHIAMVCDSGSLKIYINGIQSGTAGSGSNFTASDITYIGQYSGASRNLTGYISNLRVLKGTALYTANFTPPTAPLTAITNTSLLLNYTNAGVIDNAMMNNLETVGNAQISTTQSKWGGSSIAFDGTGDWLLAPSSPNFAIDGNFTVEMWVYFNNTTTYVFFDMRGIGTAAPNNPVLFWSNSASKIQAYINDDFRITSGTLNTAQWYHVALTRSGTTVTLYVDGVSQGTYTYSASITQQALYVGTGSGLNSFNGYIDDLRITKGFARYTANFTPPSGPFFTR
jgi:hypothetical protein